MLTDEERKNLKEYGYYTDVAMGYKNNADKETLEKLRDAITWIEVYNRTNKIKTSEYGPFFTSLSKNEKISMVKYNGQFTDESEEDGKLKGIDQIFDMYDAYTFSKDAMVQKALQDLAKRKPVYEQDINSINSIE